MAKRTTAKPAQEQQIDIIQEAQTEQTAAPEEKKEVTGFTQSQVDEMIAQAVAKAMEQQKKQQAAVPSASDMVTMRFMAEVNDRNVVYLGKDGKYGQIIGKRWMGQIPKMAFIGDFRTPLIQQLLKTRNLIVMDGLTDDERKLYGVMYASGEVIDDKLYDRLVRMEEKDLVPIYRGLCAEWRRMLAVKFADAFDRGELKVSRGTLLELNRISKRDNRHLSKDDVLRKGAFYPLIQKLNYAEDAEDE